MEEPAKDYERRLETFKAEKFKAKTSFTRARRKLLSLIDDDHQPRRNEVRINDCESLNLALQSALRVMDNLWEEYSRRGDRYNRKKIGREMEQLESEFTDAQNRAQDYLDKTKPESSASESVLSEAESDRRKETELEPHPVSREFQDPREWKRDLHDPHPVSRELQDPREWRRDLYEPHPVSRELQDPREWKGDLHEPHPDSRKLRDHYEMPYTDLYQEDLKPRPFIPAPMTFSGKGSAETSAVTIGRDMWTQLERVAIPVFSGNKKTYESWKAAFTACIDKAPATPEYKLLQLRQYLSGEALKTIESLGHSGYAYEAAKERLDRKFGDQCH